MEQITFKNSRNLTLVGNFNPSISKSVIIMCHGFTSDKNSRGRFPKLAKVFNEYGFNVLSFDFSGCGESDDDSLTIEKEVDDLKSAIVYVKSKGYEKIGLYGHSLGSLICLRNYIPEIGAMVLLGALTDRMKYNWDEFFNKEEMEELNKKGYITQYISEGLREKIIINREMLDGFELINQNELLKDIKCPVLIIHGNNDEEENLLSDKSKAGMDLLSTDSKLKIIDAADHSFFDHFDTVIKLSVDWFREYLK